MRAFKVLGGVPFWLLVVIMQVANWFAMLLAAPGWTVSWRQAIDSGVGTVNILGPVLAGLVAASYAHLRQTSFADLVLASGSPLRPRSILAWLGPAVQSWGAAALSLVILLAALTVRAATSGASLNLRAYVIVPVGLIVLGVHALIGLAIGLRAGPRSAPVLAVIVSFGLFLLANNHLAPPSFNTGGVTGPMFGEQYRISAVIVLAAFAVGSAVVLLPWSTIRAGAEWWRWGVTGAAAALMIVLAQHSWPDLEARLEPASVTFRCAGADPQLCLVADRPDDDLAETARRFGAMATSLRQAGAELPARWNQALPGQRVLNAGRFSLRSDAEIGGRPSDMELLTSLTMPEGCRGFSDGTEPLASLRARYALLTWIARRNGIDTGGSAQTGVARRTSDAWVRTTYAQLRGCDLGAVRRP